MAHLLQVTEHETGQPLLVAIPVPALQIDSTTTKLFPPGTSGFVVDADFETITHIQQTALVTNPSVVVL